MRPTGLPRYEKEIKLLLFGLIYLSMFMPLIVGTAFLFPFVFPKAIFFQTLMQLGFLLYLALLVIDRGYLPRFSWILAAASGYLLLIAITTFLGVDPSLSFWSKAERMDGLFQYLHLGVFLIILLSIFRSELDWLRLFRFVIFTGWLTGVVALAARYFPAMLNLGNQTRLGATFGNPAFLSTYFLVLVFLALIFLLRSRASVERWFFGVSLIFFLWILLLSGTRGAFVGLLVGIVSLLFALLVADWKRWGRPVIVAFVLLVIIAVSVYFARDLLWEFWPRIAERIFGIWQFPPARLVSWRIGLEAFKARPLIGWGPENYIYAFNLHFDPEIHVYELALFDRAHNKIIDLAVMNGILGPMAYFLIFGIIFWQLFLVLRKRLVNPLWAGGFLGLMVGYFVQNLVLFEMPTSGLLFFLLIGFLAWLSSELRFEEKKLKTASQTSLPPRNQPTGLLPSWILIIALGLISFAFAIGIWQPARASKALVRSASLLGDFGDPQGRWLSDAFNAYQRAREHSTYLDREVDMALGRRLREVHSGNQRLVTDPTFQNFAERLITSLEEDAKRHPLDYDVLMEAGNLSFVTEQVKPDLASRTEAFWLKAMKLAPKREDAYLQFSLWYQAKGDFEHGRGMLDRILELNDRIGIFWWHKAVLEARRGDEVAMWAALKRARNLKYLWDEMPGNLEFLGATFARQNKPLLAIPFYEKLITATSESELPWPVLFRSHAALGSLYVAVARMQEAKDLLKRLLEIAPPSEKPRVESLIKDLGLSR